VVSVLRRSCLAEWFGKPGGVGKTRLALDRRA